jgi:membrane dipeptidase
MRIFLFVVLFTLTVYPGHLYPNENCKSVEREAQRIHEAVLTIDTHSDTPMKFTNGKFDMGEYHDPYKSGLKVDFPRMKNGGLDAQFFAIFIGQGERTAEKTEMIKSDAFSILESIKKETGKYPDLAEIATTPDDAYKLEKEGKRAVFIGLENGYPIGKDLSVVKKFYDSGVRYITLCHTSNNDMCDSSNDRKGPEHGGLSGFGEEVVKEMNRLGMIVDVSHISDSSFFDVIKITGAPVIASHSCAREICDNPRNLNDEQLLAIARNGGVVQMCILSDYVKTPDPYPARDSVKSALIEKYDHFVGLSDERRKEAWKEWDRMNKVYPPKLASVKDVVDHIDHIVKVAGIDHVGIGTDFDGGGALSDCYDVSQMENITIELVRRGYSEVEIRKIWGGNFMRVFRKVIETGELIQEDIAQKNVVKSGSY